MQVYFNLLHKDTKASAFGETYIVPNAYLSTTLNDPTPLLSHDCTSHAELERVIDSMIADLTKLKKKSKVHFDKLIKAKKDEHARRT